MFRFMEHYARAAEMSFALDIRCIVTLWQWSSDGWAKNQLGERRLGELVFGRQTIGRQARTVRRQQIGRLGDIVQTVGRNV